MKLLLILPKYVYDNNINTKRNYHYEFSLGISYISAYLKKHTSYEIDCLNLNHLDGTIESLVNDALDKKKYNVVCSGHDAPGYLVLEKIINAIYNHPSKPVIIAGGPIVTSEPELITELLSFNYGVIGEGEETILELLKCIEQNGDPKKVNGIIYKDKNKMIKTNPRQVIKDLDELPFPDFESFGFEEKLNNSYSCDGVFEFVDYPRTYPIIGSRSCPFNCTFCFHTIPGAYRVRSVDNIIKEIKFAMDKYKINSINLLDDLFASNKVRLKEFCIKLKKLTKSIPDFKWSCALWVSTTDEEIILMLKDAGCVGIGFGFESYSKKVLKSMNKHITPEQIDNAIKLCMKLKMPILGNFIFGDVAETKETAKETIDYWKKNCKDQVKLFFIHPYPGSKIYKHCFEKGIIKDKVDLIKNKLQHTNILNMTNEMTDKEFTKLKKDIFKAKLDYGKYLIPLELKKTGKKDAYDLKVICPYCNKVISHKNWFIVNKHYFHNHIHCRECGMRYHVVSRLYYFTTKYYIQLDFFRKHYLWFRDKLLKARL